MPTKTLLITPPFTQLNTPYPATAYLKGVHQLTTTVHSPIGKKPKSFEIEITGPPFEGFALNDL